LIHSNQLRSGSYLQKSGANTSKQRGFTLIELMIVIMIILILVGMAAQRYEKAILHAREATLAHDLFVMRQAIDSYATDKLSAPQSLDDLVSEHYLRSVPIDPITQQKDWQPKFGSYVYSTEQVSVGIEDVRSNSDKYSEW
jgi:general secretion pathway protein G